MTKKKKLFECKTPCRNCPYRKDSKLAHWSIQEFIKVLDAEKSLMGNVFLCHKNDGAICVGFLMDQVERDLPSNSLRLSLMRADVDRNFLESLVCKSERFETIEEMCEANFPELKNYE